MTPNQLQDMASELSALYAQAEERLTAAVARRLARGVEEPGWANRKLEEVQAFRSELTRELETLSRSAAEMRSAMLDAAWDTGESGLTDELGVRLEVIPQARLAGIAAIETELSQKFDALQSAVLRAVDDQYRSIIGQAVAAQATGTITTKQALKQALNAFADRGISGFTDRAGRRWGMAEYSEMAVRTGMMRAAIAGYSADALEHGETLVIVSDHADECPLCRPWERKVLAIAPEGLRHPECQGTLDAARAAGLFHPNCLHSITVYVPGLTDRTGSKERAGITPAQDAKGYASRQQQRSMERNVRKWKRRQAAAIDPEDERIARAYVVKWQRQLRALTGETKLPRKYDREGGRVLLSDAAKKLKALQIDENGSIIKNSRNTAWLRRGYDKAVERGDLSALTGFEHYVRVAENVDRELIGLTTADGIAIEGYVPHFLDRIIGSYEQNREPVEIKFIMEALLNPQEILRKRPRNGLASDIYVTAHCKVSVNPDRRLLIQVTPKERG
jgi:hypothetical protein